MQASLTNIYVTNAFGVVLTSVVLAGNLWRLNIRNSGNFAILCLLVLSLLNCIVDSAVFSSDGGATALDLFINHFGNAWLYVSNMFCAFLWLIFLTRHVCGGVSRRHLNVLIVLLVIGSVGVVINYFEPFIFSIDANNVYHRHNGYWMYTLIDYGMTIDSIFMYFWSRRQNVVLKYFPIWVYLFPLMIGTLAQTMFYGISTISASLAVSMAGVFTSLQNELIFRDRLTGLYNRAYLDHYLKSYMRMRRTTVTGLMMDMNAFKKINDDFGHSVGDEALIKMAELLQKSVGSVGIVIRYAGDEFIVLLNTQNIFEVDSCVQAIDMNLEKFNETSGKPYKLSVSIGQGELDLQKNTIDEFINKIDHSMYENKKAFYAAHATADRES